MSHVFVVYCVGNGLSNGLITRSEKTYRLCVMYSFSLQKATEAHRVSRGIALPFHDLGA